MQNYLHVDDYRTPCRSSRGGMAMEACTNKWIAYFFTPGGKICFDTFIAISCWFLVDQTFKTERFLKMWLEVFFYSVGTMVVAALLGSTFGGFEWFGACLPITGAVQGYAQTYLAFYLMLPLLTKLSNGMNKNQNIFVIIVMTFFVFLFRFISNIIWSEQSIYCRLILFVYIYFLMRYAKKYPLKWQDNAALMLIVFAVGYGLLYVYYVCTVQYPEWTGWKWLTILVIDEGGILFMITGLAFFFFFKSIRMSQIKWINTLAASSFAVILIHDGHFFRGWTWSLLKTTEWYYSDFYFVRIILCEILIYLVCTVIDYVRKYALEKPIFKIKAIKTFCGKCDALIADNQEELLHEGI